MRRLISIRRHVPLDQLEEYRAAWDIVRTAVETAGCRAWHFRAAGHDNRFLEFIEWTEDVPAPLWDIAFKGLLTRMAELAVTSHQEEWEEAT